MSLTVMKLMLVLGIIGHALNMYCDRILSVFPNGTLKLEDIKTFGKDEKKTRLMEGVSAWCSKYAVWYRRKSQAEGLAFIFTISFNMPCVSALVATARETHSVKWTAKISVFYTAAALIASCIVYHIGLLVF